MTSFKDTRLIGYCNDPFAPGRSMPFGYDCTETNWILTSPGPDGVYDMDPRSILRLTRMDSSSADTTAKLAHLTYNPTNGAVSRGDIWRMKQ